MATKLRSYAKVNLGLTIGPARADGFHSLVTVYQTIDLWDVVTVSAAPSARREVAVECADARVPTDARNTCHKIVTAALELLSAPLRVKVGIEKRLPVQGGLGAGSANAAAALLGLNAELRRLGAARELNKEECLRLAAETGSDVPLFLVGGAVLGTGRGEQVEALEDVRSYPVVVAVPELAVSTPHAFRDWDARSALTGQRALGRLEVSSQAVARVWARAGSSGANPAGEGLAEDPFLALVRTGIENDFETVVLPQHPLLRDLKHALAGTPTQKLAGSADSSAIWAGLSGSGSSLFGVYRTADAARAAAGRVEQLGAKALVTRTLGREEYWREMWLAGE